MPSSTWPLFTELPSISSVGFAIRSWTTGRTLEATLITRTVLEDATSSAPTADPSIRCRKKVLRHLRRSCLNSRWCWGRLSFVKKSDLSFAFQLYANIRRFQVEKTCLDLAKSKSALSSSFYCWPIFNVQVDKQNEKKFILKTVVNYYESDVVSILISFIFLSILFQFFERFFINVL